jgi:DNA/RNA endonuclease YhcR with UshA esterase domain
MKKLIILLILPLVLSGCAYKIVKDDSNNSGNQNSVEQGSAPLTTQVQVPTAITTLVGDKTEVIDYTQATNFVGESKTVKGSVVKVYYSAKSDTTFLDFCTSYNGCPFSSVIFSSDKGKFGNINQYEGKTVEITGLITTYKGGAEIILKNPSQINIVE